MKWISLVQPLLIKSTVCKQLQKTSTYFWWGGEDGRDRGRIVCANVFMFSF